MSDLAIHEPAGVVAVHDQCDAIERWAAECQSVPELRDAGNRLAAIDEYLQRTSTEGRSRVAAAMRRLEVRIGELLGPAQVGGGNHGNQHDPRPSVATKGLSPDQRHDFREMAANPEVVEKVIEDSTDDEPASRRKVQEAIARSAPAKRRASLVDTARNAGWEFRKAVERMERIVTDDRFPANREQVAAQLNDHLLYALEVCQDLAHHMEGTSE